MTHKKNNSVCVDMMFETSIGYELWQTLAKMKLTDSLVVIKVITYDGEYSGDSFSMIEKEAYFIVNRKLANEGSTP